MFSFYNSDLNFNSTDGESTAVQRKGLQMLREQQNKMQAMQNNKSNLSQLGLIKQQSSTAQLRIDFTKKAFLGQLESALQ